MSSTAWKESIMKDACTKIPQIEQFTQGDYASRFPITVGAVGTTLAYLPQEEICWSHLYTLRHDNEHPTILGHEESLSYSTDEKWTHYDFNCELKFDETTSLSCPSQIVLNHAEEIPEVAPTFVANCILNASITSGNRHLRDKLIPLAAMESHLTPGEPVTTGVIVRQYEYDGERWSVGIAADVTDGIASGHYIFLTNGKDKFAELSNEIIEEKVDGHSHFRDIPQRRNGVADLPEAIALNIGERSAQALASAESIYEYVLSGEAATHYKGSKPEQDSPADFRSHITNERQSSERETDGRGA